MEVSDVQATVAIPSVTVLVPILNGAAYLPDFLQHLERNVDPNDEVIIVDDNSTDATLEIIYAYQAKFPDVIKCVQNPHSGLVSALNYGVQLARHNWIARFDVDDAYDPNRLLLQKKELGTHVAAVFCDYEFFTNSRKNLGVIKSAVLPNASLLSLISGQRTPHPGVVFNKAYFLKVGGYRQESYPAEDLSLWLRMASVGELKTVPKTLLFYRISEQSVTGLNRNLAISKMQELVKSTQILRSAYFDSLSDLPNTLEVYSNMSGGNERILLHFRDLLIALNYFGSYGKFFKSVMRFKVFLAIIKSFPYAIKLRREKRQRTKLRLNP